MNDALSDIHATFDVISETLDDCALVFEAEKALSRLLLSLYEGVITHNFDLKSRLDKLLSERGGDETTTDDESQPDAGHANAANP